RQPRRQLLPLRSPWTFQSLRGHSESSAPTRSTRRWRHLWTTTMTTTTMTRTTTTIRTTITWGPCGRSLFSTEHLRGALESSTTSLAMATAL
ncbi:hypothetical protein H4217_008369, partial [Coemansia sp. RSA 1939]